MRRLDEISDDSDIYQSVSEEDLQSVEAKFGFVFPEVYRRFVESPDIETIQRLPALLWFVRYSSVGIFEVNAELRGRDFQPYPDHLIAFATNECGDYFCFDRDTGRVVYIDPECSIEENLMSGELVCDSFGQWVASHLKQ